MGLIRPAPVSIPWSAHGQFYGAGTANFVRPNDFTPAFLVIAGIELVDIDFQESSIVQVRTYGGVENPMVLFQAQVYATSQADFSWRGEFVVATGTTVDVHVAGGRWDISMWGAIIPNSTIEP